MTNYTIETSNDGIISSMKRDGIELECNLKFEPPFKISSIYFKIARSNILLLKDEVDQEKREAFGLQAFVMNLIGIEAFSNVYFRLYGEERKNLDLIKLAKTTSGPLKLRIVKMIESAFQKEIDHQDEMIENIDRLIKTRNSIVHPKFSPANINIKNENGEEYNINSMTLSQYEIFSNYDFCLDSIKIGTNFIYEIGRMTSGDKDLSGFMFRWMGILGFDGRKPEFGVP